MFASESVSILIVEDELIVAESLALDLQRKGYTIAGIVSSGEEAIRAISVTEPDLVLMDIMLKGSLDGIEASRAIRHQRPLPIIYITAFSDRATLERARQESEPKPLYYLVKPIRLKDLVNTIQTALLEARPDLQMREKAPLSPKLDRRSSAAPPPPDYLVNSGSSSLPEELLPYDDLDFIFQDQELDLAQDREPNLDVTPQE